MSYRDAVRALKPVYFSEGTDEEVATARQDYADGAALRRLREALPDGGWYVAHGDAEDAGASIGAYSPIEGVRHVRPSYGRGATVAEAADACREALDSRDDSQRA